MRCLSGLSMGVTAWLIARYHLSPYVFDNHYTENLGFAAKTRWPCQVFLLCLQQTIHASAGLLRWHATWAHLFLKAMRNRPGEGARI